VCVKKQGGSGARIPPPFGALAPVPPAGPCSRRRLIAPLLPINARRLPPPLPPPAHSLRCRWCRGSQGRSRTFWWPRCRCPAPRRTRGTRLRSTDLSGRERGRGWPTAGGRVHGAGFCAGGPTGAGALAARRSTSRGPLNDSRSFPQRKTPPPPLLTGGGARCALEAGAGTIARVHAHALAAVGAGRAAGRGVDALGKGWAGAGVSVEAGGAGLAAVTDIGGTGAVVAA
jgi:hypothetical protein